ncbi:SDR family oxidoreductase [soil metagenome]
MAMTASSAVWDDAPMTDDRGVALITGATGSLGRAAAPAFARAGYRLGLGGTDRGRLDTLAEDLGLDRDAWLPVTADLADAEAARAAVSGLEEHFGRIDVLLHLVGGWTGGTTLVDLDPGVLRDMLDQHVWSTFHVTRAVVPGMVERGHGRILAVTSSFTAAPSAKSTPYIAAKAAQEALLRVLAREVAGTGVTANLVAVKSIDAERQRETAPSPKNASWTTPDEIVAVLRFLASDDAAAVNGQRIALDGRA